MKSIRYRGWNLLRKNVPEGSLLPGWLICIRAVLFPIDFIYYKINTSIGYQFQHDIWIIEGIKYSGEAMRALALSAGEVYRITNINGVVCLETLNEVK